MAAQQTGAPAAPAAGVSAPATLDQANAQFANDRASRLDGAIEAALAGRLNTPAPPEGAVDPKAGKRRTAGAARASTAPGSGTSTPPGSRANGSGSRASSPASTAPRTPASPASGSPTSAPSGSDALSTTSELSSEGGDADAGLAALEAGETGDDPAEVADDGAPLEGEEGQDEAFADVDRVELDKLAKRKDFRGIEKLLGLEVGVLGATNSEFAALRRREDAVAAREASVTQTHESNNQKLIAKFGGVADLVQLASQGNLRAYAATVERTTGLPIRVFVDLWNQNVAQIPPDQLAIHQRAARFTQPQQAPQLPAAPEAQQQPATPEAARTAALAKANAHVAAEAKGHPALALKGGADDVRQAWLSSYDKASNSFKLTPKQAADQVVQARRQENERESWLLSGRRPPAPARTRSAPRQRAEAQVVEAGPVSRQDAIEKHARIMRNAKVLERRQSSR